MMEVIKRPILTEKNTRHMEENSYSFEVDCRATKAQIRAAVQKAFKVNVIGVRTMVGRKDPKRVGNAQRFGKKRYYKKALVKVAAGEKIQLFEGV